MVLLGISLMMWSMFSCALLTMHVSSLAKCMLESFARLLCQVAFMSLESHLYSLDSKLHQIGDLKIFFPQSVACIFILTVPFKERKFLGHLGGSVD